MLFALVWQDHLVIVAYLLAMVGIGWYASRKQQTEEEYFLASRSLPSFALGVSIIATLMSSLTYLSEPGEVWQSGITKLIGKNVAVLLEMILLLFVLIPFLMRYRFTSVYEYLGHRFGMTTRTIGVLLFCGLIITWMGFVVLAMGRSFSQVTGYSLATVIFTVGLLATSYTTIGGYRAVVWTEVAQVGLMLFGCFATIVYVIIQTGTWIPDWIASSYDYLQAHGREVTIVSLDPFHRTSIVTAGLSMFVWSLCTHAGNQMTVQRYFSSPNITQARRSFVIASLLSILIYALLAFVGLAIGYYYTHGFGQLSLNPEIKKQADLIFPMFMVEVLPPGLTGAVLTAVLAAAMSTIDSAINSLSTVLSIERQRWVTAQSGLWFAKTVTLLAGILITCTAFGLDQLTLDRNIVEMMPRTFNCFLIPLGGLFLIGMFFPSVGQTGAILSATAGFLATVSISYARELFGLSRDISFTWVIPGGLLILLLVATSTGFLLRKPNRETIRPWTWR